MWRKIEFKFGRNRLFSETAWQPIFKPIFLLDPAIIRENSLHRNWSPIIPLHFLCLQKIEYSSFFRSYSSIKPDGQRYKHIYHRVHKHIQCCFDPLNWHQSPNIKVGIRYCTFHRTFHRYTFQSPNISYTAFHRYTFQSPNISYTAFLILLIGIKFQTFHIHFIEHFIDIYQ